MTVTRRKIIGRAVFWFLLMAPFWAVLWFLIAGPSFLQWWNSVPFDSEVWKQGHAHERFDMVYDLRRHYGLVGKSSKEIEQLLGKPSFTDHRSEQGGLPRFSRDASPCQVEYWYLIGREKYHPLGGKDDAFLVVGFEDEVVVKVWIGGA